MADGCSAGTESHFAATLVTKILRRTARQTGLRLFAERATPGPLALLRATTATVFSDLARYRTDLSLEPLELLTTLVLAVVDLPAQTAEIIVVGDGVVACNEEIVVFEQDNKPDYMGYHLAEDFDDYWSRLTQRVSAENVHDLALATDGVFSLRPFSYDSYPPVTEQELLQFLLTERSGEINDTYYRRRLLYVRDHYGLAATDDLSVVRLML